MEISVKKDGKEVIKAPLCPHCGEPMLWSFCLPYCEYVCVPCGDGVGMCEAGKKVDFPAEEIKALREKYAADLHKRSYETAKAGGGGCTICGTKFTCEKCQEAEQHIYQYWGKGAKNE